MKTIPYQIDEDFLKDELFKESVPEITDDDIFIQHNHYVKKRGRSIRKSRKTDFKEAFGDYAKLAVKKGKGGMVLEVKKHERKELDAYLFFDNIVNTANKIILRENSSLRLGIHFSGKGKINVATLITLEKGAKLELAEDSATGFVVHTINATLDTSSSIEMFSAMLNPAILERKISLNGKKSSLREIDVFLAEKDRTVIITNVDHNAADTTGKVWVQGVCKNDGKSLSKGLMKINKKAPKTDSFLSQHALLLNKEAKADCIPDLEIENNDVKASHSASVSPINEEQIFYLESRGLSRAEAKIIIALGYLEPAIVKMKESDILRETILKRLHG